MTSSNILNFSLVKTPNTRYSDAQVFLQEFTGKEFSRNEAEIVWSKVLNHKWNVSERLSRDIGLRVAAIDFMENFYSTTDRSENQSTEADLFSQDFERLKSFVIKYFEAKSKTLNY